MSHFPGYGMVGPRALPCYVNPRTLGTNELRDFGRTEECQVSFYDKRILVSVEQPGGALRDNP